MRLGTSLLLALSLAACLQPPMPGAVGPRTASGKPAGPYAWRNVTILGGGFVTGIVFSTAERDLIYARTDIGGAYRYSPKDESWIPITDMFGRADANFYGIESIALDPTHADRVYLAAGTYTQSWAGDSALLRSENRGVSWEVFRTPFRMGGNENGRSNGERLAVDPNAPDQLLFGSRKNGLLRSLDRAQSWANVEGFPTADLGEVGVVAVLFDAKSGQPGAPTPVIYAATSSVRASVLRSRDAGKTWEPLPGQFPGLMASHLDLDGSGMLYLTLGNQPGPSDVTAGAVYRFDPKTDGFTDITPLAPRGEDTFGYGGLAVDRQHPGTVMVTTIDRWTQGDEIFRTTDGGTTWQAIGSKSKYDENGAKYLFWGRPGPLKTPHWMGDIDLDPFDSGRAAFVTGAGLWMSRNATAADPTWKFTDRGLEETAVGQVVSPPSGPLLLTGVGDICGFRHDDLDQPSPTGFYGNPGCNGSTGIDYAEQDPRIVVRVGRVWGKEPHGAYSQDGGSTWTPFEKEPPRSETGGLVAVTSDGGSWVWSRKGAVAAYSRDRGKSWTEVEGAPGAARVADWAACNLQPAADRVDPKRVLLFDASAGSVYASRDGGARFAESFSGLPQLAEYELGPASVQAVPGKQGHFWITVGKGLYRSTDGGEDFDSVRSVEEAYGIGFGKATPGADYPALYLSGTVKGQQGYFRSDDEGDSWVRINDDDHQYGHVNIIEGDFRVYGRVYLGTSGRGVMVGEPLPAP